MVTKLASSKSVPIPFAEDDGVSRAEAAAFAGRHSRTIDGYIARWPELVERRFGRVRISKTALAMLCRRDTYALRLFGAGDRAHPRVLPYYELAGVTPPASTTAEA